MRDNGSIRISAVVASLSHRIEIRSVIHWIEIPIEILQEISGRWNKGWHPLSVEIDSDWRGVNSGHDPEEAGNTALLEVLAAVVEHSLIRESDDCDDLVQIRRLEEYSNF